MARRLACLPLLAVLALPAGAGAQSAPDFGTAFVPREASKPLYAIKEPASDPARQRHYVQGADGARIFVQVWLPAAKAGKAPPARVPVILNVTPYATASQIRVPEAIDYFVQRGYAFAQSHVRGTGESGGCLEQTAEAQIEDTARVIEWLGRDATFSDGSVGMIGKSYDAETQISVAGRGDPAKVRYLKAIVPVASVGGQYEYSFFDGVPYAGQALLSNSAYLATSSLTPIADEPGADKIVQKLTCQPEMFAASTDTSGDMTPFWAEREYRPGAGRITAATLLFHGLQDFNVKPITAAGFFDRLPPSTPKSAVFGVWEHDYPGEHELRSEWTRSDYFPMVGAWMDRWLKGLRTGVERWPRVQVQATDGQWRAEPDWPTTGGPAGQLALGPDGRLGVQSPEGSTSYVEGIDEGLSLPQARAAFETESVRTPLHLAGQPVLDLHVVLDRPDAHIGAELEVLDGEGVPVPGGKTFGMRSAQHLGPFVDGRFAQERGTPAPIGEPVRVQMRFLPADLRVPAGGRLRLTVAAGLQGSLPSGLGTRVTLLHDCAHPSALRFLMPRRKARLLNVRESDEQGVPVTRKAPRSDATGGGLATAAVCGQAPVRTDVLGPPRRDRDGMTGRAR